jgi:hypothetical protein
MADFTVAMRVAASNDGSAHAEPFAGNEHRFAA